MAQVDVPLKVQKYNTFLNLQKDTNFEISSILQCQHIHEGICIRLENWEQQETHVLSRKPQKTKH